MDPSDIFDVFDSVGDGKISISQVGDVLRALGENPTISYLNKLLCKFKSNDRIDFNVFLPLYQSVCKAPKEYKAEEFFEIFRKIDKDGDGVISHSQLKYILTRNGEKLTEEEVDELLSDIDDVDGVFDYNKLVLKLLNTD